MAAQYITWNAAAPTTAAIVPVTTGTAIKTMLQLLSTRLMRVTEWGVWVPGGTAATSVQVSLITTGTVAATVTAHVAAGVPKYNPATEAAAAPMTLSTTGTGYTASAEGSVVASRFFDHAVLSTTTTQGDRYVKQFPLGREPVVTIADLLRVRAYTTTAVTMVCYVAFEA